MNGLLAVLLALLIITVPLAVVLIVLGLLFVVSSAVMDAWDYITGPHEEEKPPATT